MKIESETFYHIYNQGNNQETTFLDKEDYTVFLEKVREKVLPFCDIVNYCLMPNHFHFLINTTDYSAEAVTLGHLELTRLSNGFRILSSQYTDYFNKKYKRSGSLWRQKTKAKNIEKSKRGDYPFTCFHYIHQNPMKAGLCKNMEDWEFSSFRDYLSFNKDSFVKRKIAYDLIDISEEHFHEESYQIINDDDISELY